MAHTQATNRGAQTAAAERAAAGRIAAAADTRSLAAPADRWPVAAAVARNIVAAPAADNRLVPGFRVPAAPKLLHNISQQMLDSRPAVVAAKHNTAAALAAGRRRVDVPSAHNSAAAPAAGRHRAAVQKRSRSIVARPVADNLAAAPAQFGRGSSWNIGAQQIPVRYTPVQVDIRIVPARTCGR